MGKIHHFKYKTVVRIPVDEILTARVATSKDVVFTMAEMISKYAKMKADEKKVDLPSRAVITSFDPDTSEFLVIFLHGIEHHK